MTMNAASRLLSLPRSARLLYGGLRASAAPFSSSSVRAAGGFAKDFKPGPYPETAEERAAAAKKYGLHPADYKPFPNDGSGFGDYPDLPPISADMKSDWTDYDDPIAKRNFAEPMIITAEQVTVDKTTLRELIWSRSTITLVLLLVGTTWFGLNYWADQYKLTMPIAPKQYPRQAESGEEKHFKI